MRWGPKRTREAAQSVCLLSLCCWMTPPVWLFAHAQVCDKYGCLLIMDASLLSDNLHFNKTREQVGTMKSLFIPSPFLPDHLAGALWKPPTWKPLACCMRHRVS